MYGRRWLWFGLVVEASKPLVGLTTGLSAFADCVHSAMCEVHGDLVAHYNYLRGQEVFREEVAYALEQLPEA